MLYIPGKFSFYHTPKTAGTSIIQGLCDSYGNMNVHQPCQDAWMQDRIHHSPIKWWYDNLLIDPSLPVFSVSRNPYPRTASWYTYLKYSMRFEKQRNAGFFDVSFRDFLIGDWMFNPTFKDYIAYDLFKKVDWNPLSTQLHHWKDYDTSEVTFVDIDNLSELEKMLSFKLPEKKLNESLQPDVHDWRNVYCLETQDMVREMYKEDFEFFGYSKDFNTLL
jgi:hypothetical protein